MRGRRGRGVIIGALFGWVALALVGAGGRMLEAANGATASASAAGRRQRGSRPADTVAVTVADPVPIAVADAHGDPVPDVHPVPTPHRPAAADPEPDPEPDDGAADRRARAAGTSPAAGRSR